jgi:hypothetical protein
MTTSEGDFCYGLVRAITDRRLTPTIAIPALKDSNLPAKNPTSSEKLGFCPHQLIETAQSLKIQPLAISKQGKKQGKKWFWAKSR